MGLVGKAKAESSVDGEGSSPDMSTLIRQAVANEIERQRLLSIEAEQTSSDSSD